MSYKIWSLYYFITDVTLTNLYSRRYWTNFTLRFEQQVRNKQFTAELQGVNTLESIFIFTISNWIWIDDFSRWTNVNFDTLNGCWYVSGVSPCHIEHFLSLFGLFFVGWTTVYRFQLACISESVVIRLI